MTNEDRQGPQDVRAETAAYRIKAECFDWDGSFNAERAYHIIRAALAQSNAEPVRVTDEMVKAASDVLFERTSIAFGGTYMREALEAALNPKQVALYTAPPRPNAEPVAQRLRSYVASRGGPAKDERGRAVGTAWPMMLEAAEEIERLAAEVEHLRSRLSYKHAENTHANTPG